MGPEQLMETISSEISSALKAMAQAETAEEKLAYSQMVKNLCDSLGVFLSFLSDIEPYGDTDEPIPF